MSVQDDTRSQLSPRVAAPAIHGARGDPAAWCSCNAMSLPSPAGAFNVLRIAGEIATVDNHAGRACRRPAATTHPPPR
jgi:hypothetical protein